MLIGNLATTICFEVRGYFEIWVIEIQRVDCIKTYLLTDAIYASISSPSDFYFEENGVQCIKN